MLGNQNKVTINIVGGGLSGLICAHSLIKSPLSAHFNIQLFDKKSTCGGRVMSANLSDTAVELGAGRYSPTLHPNVHELLLQQQRELAPFPFTQSAYGHTDNTQIRERLIFLKQQLVNFPEHTFFEFLCHFEGEEETRNILNNIGYKALFLPNITAEIGFDVIEKHPETQRHTANFDNNWFCPKDGFGAMIKDLQQDILNYGVRIYHDYSLLNVNGCDKSSVLRFEHQGNIVNIDSENTLFALPPSAMSDLNINFPKAWSPHQYSFLPLFKAYFYFQEPWWQPLGLTEQFIICETPLSKLYFSNDNYLFFYCDSEDANFWQQNLNKSRTTYIKHIKSYLAQSLNIDQDKIPPPIAHANKFWPKGVEFSLDSKPLPSVALTSSENGIVACSDAYTSHCGWMEGSIVSAKKAANILLERIEKQTCGSLLAVN